MLSQNEIAGAINNINDWNKNLSEQLKKEKFRKMAQSPYYFFRGTNHLFWKYFANDQRMQLFTNENSNTWIQGDLHAYNYGIYGDKTADLVYGLNDFDESCIANYQFDLWRMACSIMLILRENGFTKRKFTDTIIHLFAESYAEVFANYIENGSVVLQKVTKCNAFGKLDDVIKEVEKKDSRKKMLERWTCTENQNCGFDLSYEKLAEISKEKRQEIEKRFANYVKRVRQNFEFEDDYFEIIDIAYRVSSGTGSYGTPRYYILIKGKSEEEFGQRILDAKLQSKPSSYVFLDQNFKNKYNQQFDNEGIRHQEAYRALNYYIDKHLSWIELSEGIFSVRERSPYKSYFPTNLLDSKKRFSKLAKQWGYILAYSHIKSSDNFDVKGIYELMNRNEPKFTDLIKQVATEFADYNDKVFKTFTKNCQ